MCGSPFGANLPGTCRERATGSPPQRRWQASLAASRTAGLPRPAKLRRAASVSLMACSSPEIGPLDQVIGRRGGSSARAWCGRCHSGMQGRRGLPDVAQGGISVFLRQPGQHELAGHRRRHRVQEPDAPRCRRCGGRPARRLRRAGRAAPPRRRSIRATPPPVQFVGDIPHRCHPLSDKDGRGASSGRYGRSARASATPSWPISSGGPGSSR